MKNKNKKKEIGLNASQKKIIEIGVSSRILNPRLVEAQNTTPHPIGPVSSSSHSLVDSHLIENVRKMTIS